jgi:alpha-galactosidase
MKTIPAAIGLTLMLLAPVRESNAAEEIAFHAQWAERAFAAQPPAASEANRLVVVHEDMPGDTKIGRGSAGGRMRLADRVYSHGIGVNSHSVVGVRLLQRASRFLCTVGLDRNVDGTLASVRFHVGVGGKDVWQSELMRAGATPVAVDVPLQGATEFDLTVDVGDDTRGWDQADWADARVIMEDGTTIWLDDIARNGQVESGLPFSFVYGGKHSSEFLAKWQRNEQVEQFGNSMTRRTLTLSDPETGLEVKCVCTVYLDTPGVDWTLHFQNRGSADTPPIEQVRSADTSVNLGFGQKAVLHRLNGSLCRVDDWMPFDQSIAEGERVEFTATDGRSSNVCPFFNLDWGSGGVITALGWSGQWSASVELKGGRLRTQAGMQSMHLVLHPGESIRSMRVMQIYWSGGDVERSYNMFRRTMLNHILPRIDGQLVMPPIAHSSTSFYELNASNEQNVLSHLDAIRGLGFETFWLDAYWTGPGGFPDSMGNYGLPLERVEPRDRFPRGLGAIGEAVARDGLSFLLWFEPERVAPGTRIAKEHPEWVISPEGNGSGLLNLGSAEAREYITDYLSEAIRAYRLGCLRIDFNINPLGYWQFLDKQDPNRVGMAEIRYVEGLYRMWDELRERHPNLFIDNCASGGRRIDLETCSRAIPLWRSDNTCDMVGDDPDVILMAALKNQLMSAGLNRYLPYSTVGQMGATPYLFRSGFNGGIIFAEDVRRKDFPREMLRQAIAEGKRIRKYWLGDFYAISAADTDPTRWIVMQLHRANEQDGIVLAFRRHASPYGSYCCDLRAIDPDANYLVAVSHGYEAAASQNLRGAELQHLEIRSAQCPGSVLVEYRKLTGESPNP